MSSGEVCTTFKREATAYATSRSRHPPRPHIIMALFDDLGANDLGIFFGGTQTPRTPFMDELMKSGIKLKQYYVQPICSPTRSALMTGRYPISTGGNMELHNRQMLHGYQRMR